MLVNRNYHTIGNNDVWMVLGCIGVDAKLSNTSKSEN